MILRLLAPVLLFATEALALDRVTLITLSSTEVAEGAPERVRAALAATLKQRGVSVALPKVASVADARTLVERVVEKRSEAMRQFEADKNDGAAKTTLDKVALALQAILPMVDTTREWVGTQVMRARMATRLGKDDEAWDLLVNLLAIDPAYRMGDGAPELRELFARVKTAQIIARAGGSARDEPWRLFDPSTRNRPGFVETWIVALLRPTKGGILARIVRVDDRGDRVRDSKDATLPASAEGAPEVLSALLHLLL